MARMPRVMFEGIPFHVTHRGNHKEQIFFSDEDRQRYLDLLRRFATRFKMSVWGHCLMDNHYDRRRLDALVDIEGRGQYASRIFAPAEPKNRCYWSYVGEPVLFDSTR